MTGAGIVDIAAVRPILERMCDRRQDWRQFLINAIAM